MARARSKAWISATQQIPSSEHLRRMTTIAPPVAAGFARASPEALFPGAGGMPVSVDGVVVADIAASGATVSPFFPAGVDPRVVSADGRAANPEDLLIAYALGIPYSGQHGDDQKRWEQRFGERRRGGRRTGRGRRVRVANVSPLRRRAGRTTMRNAPLEAIPADPRSSAIGRFLLAGCGGVPRRRSRRGRRNDWSLRRERRRAGWILGNLRQPHADELLALLHLVPARGA